MLNEGKSRKSQQGNKNDHERKNGKYRTETTISENKFSLDKLSSQIKVTKERSGELEEVT